MRSRPPGRSSGGASPRFRRPVRRAGRHRLSVRIAALLEIELVHVRHLEAAGAVRFEVGIERAATVSHGRRLTIATGRRRCADSSRRGPSPRARRPRSRRVAACDSRRGVRAKRGGSTCSGAPRDDELAAGDAEVAGLRVDVARLRVDERPCRTAGPCCRDLRPWAGGSSSSSECRYARARASSGAVLRRIRVGEELVRRLCRAACRTCRMWSSVFSWFAIVFVEVYTCRR